MKGLYIDLQDEVCEPEKGNRKGGEECEYRTLNLASCPLRSTAPTVSILGFACFGGPLPRSIRCLSWTCASIRCNLAIVSPPYRLDMAFMKVQETLGGVACPSKNISN
jgi:hypothetical protein